MSNLKLFGKFCLYSDSFGNLGMRNDSQNIWTVFEKNSIFFFRELSTGYYLTIDKYFQLVARPFNRELYQAWIIERENSRIVNFRTRQAFDSNLLGFVYPKKRGKAVNWTIN